MRLLRRECERNEMAERGVWKEWDGRKGSVEGLRWQRRGYGRSEMA